MKTPWVAHLWGRLQVPSGKQELEDWKKPQQLSSVRDLLLQVQVPTKLRQAVHGCNPNTGEAEAGGSGVRGHPLLHRKLQVSLGYRDLVSKKLQTKNGKSNLPTRTKLSTLWLVGWFKIGSYLAQAGLELVMEVKLALNSWSSCLCLLVAGVTVMCHDAQMYTQYSLFSFYFIL